MQLHGPSEPIDAIPVEPYGTSGSVGLRLPACMWLVLTSPADADRLIIAATQAKDLMLVTQPENDPAEGVPGWDDPLPPVRHLPHLHERQGANPMCVLCGIDLYALRATEQTADGA